MLMAPILSIVKNSDAIESKKIIGADITWHKAESPYIIKDSIVVLSGVTLTIEPGVVVKFDKDRALQIDGTLIAKGTPDEKITFTRNASDNWGYIFFSDSSIDAAYDANGDYTAGSILEHCIVEYAGSTNVGNNGAIRLENAHPFINYCTIQNNSAPGIMGWNLSSTLTIANTNISNNNAPNYSAGGIYILSNGTTNILHNTISKNTTGIYVFSYTYGNGTLEISNNTINNNIGVGAVIYCFSNNNGTANISNNIINSNTSGGVQIVGSNGTTNFSSNIVLNNSAGNGISASGGAAINIVKNIIGNNTSDYNSGIYTTYGYYDRGGPINISYNSLIRNSARNCVAASLNYGANSDFKYNTITNNKATDDNNSAVFIVGTPPTFNYNNIFTDNTTYELWYANAKGSGMLNAQYNWWGTSNEDEIANKIHDFGDDGSYDIVNYFNYDTAIRTDAPISPPTGLTATSGNGQISLSWNANPEADTAGYKVYWNTTSGFPYANSADVGNQTNYTITSLPTGEYYVTVTAYDNQYLAGKDDPKTIVNDNQTNGNESWFAEEQHVTVSTTGTFPPKATTKPATNISMNSAKLNGVANARGQQTKVWFDYSTTSGTYSNSTPQKTIGGRKNRKTANTIKNLSPGTPYYYRIVAENNDGKNPGVEMSFTTPADAKPIVTTGDATGITTNSATLNVTVNPNGLQTKAWFVYGTESGSLTNETAKTDVSGKITKKISANITGLSPGIPYYYKIIAENSEGTREGDEKKFTTMQEGETLLEKYAPILYMHPDERFHPTNIQVMLDNSEVYKRTTDNYGYYIGIMEFDNAQNTLTPEKLMSDYNTSEYYLQLKKEARESAEGSGLWKTNQTVYGRQFNSDEDPTKTILQYWFFYVFNDWGNIANGGNSHEGDWEMIQIIVSNEQPEEITYSIHRGGMTLSWIDPKVPKDNRYESHPRVYVNFGGHGSWNKTGDNIWFQWQKAVCLKCIDRTSDQGDVLYPKTGYFLNEKYTYNLVSLNLPESSWVYWNGYWGQQVFGIDLGSSGPNSPTYVDYINAVEYGEKGQDGRWYKPITWKDAPLPSGYTICVSSNAKIKISNQDANKELAILYKCRPYDIINCEVECPKVNVVYSENDLVFDVYSLDGKEVNMKIHRYKRTGESYLVEFNGLEIPRDGKATFVFSPDQNPTLEVEIDGNNDGHYESRKQPDTLLVK